MRQTKVASRYAKALFDLAVESGSIEKVKADVDLILASGTPEFHAVIASPVIRGDKKEKIFAAIFEKKVTPLTIAFFNLLFRKGREIAMKDILSAFMDLYRKLHNIQKVEITTAEPVTDEIYQAILTQMKKVNDFGKVKFEVSPRVDPSIIGGFVLQVGDTLFDASIRHDLQVIRKQFVQNMYIQNIK